MPWSRLSDFNRPKASLKTFSASGVAIDILATFLKRKLERGR